MASLSVVYPRTPGATFDYDYYRSRHMPLVGERWADAGLTGGEALLGEVAPDGSQAPYFAIGIIHFDTVERLRRGESVPKRIQTVESVFDRSQVTPELLKSRGY